MKRNQSFSAKVLVRNNGLEIDSLACIKPCEFRPYFDTILLYAVINKNTGQETGVYIDANEFKNNFEKVE